VIWRKYEVLLRREVVKGAFELSVVMVLGCLLTFLNFTVVDEVHCPFTHGTILSLCNPK
jgi:hypothetical protein